MSMFATQADYWKARAELAEKTVAETAYALGCEPDNEAMLMQAGRLREALLRLREWGGIANGNYCSTVMLGVTDWIDGGMVGELPALPDHAAPNDRVEGRDAALSRRVPSHDGLCGNGNYNERTDK